ncbi:hypothetical protein [Paludibaculum fermentans]|uniref:Uncharacterized protein n=1 Tax=Paludibaculum fermentans TaxID=1473598 RepID=A0A7S7SGN1_PALFE|nr:hypothetical protein [Paludibaculum fermentans]QOY85012.1 hypothetical protein IRI77_19375 [Paludibaculum fermentans]
MGTGSIRLDFATVGGTKLQDQIHLDVVARDGTTHYESSVQVNGTIQIGGIDASPVKDYQVTVWPMRYRPSSFFVRVQDGKVARQPVTLPVNPDKVSAIDAPVYAKLPAQLKAILETSSIDTQPTQQGEALYTALDAQRQACLLNIAIKASATILGDGTSCFSHMGGLLKLRRDRFFVRTTAALFEETQNASRLFHEVSEALHHPPDGYQPAKSFKTFDKYGNLQLSFFRQGETGDHYLVDVDIDEAQYLEHAFEVIRNAVLDHTTNPYDVHEVLVGEQKLNPGYDFVFPQAAQITVSAKA